MITIRTFMTALVAALIAAPAPAQPKLVVKGGTSFDFGKIYRGDVREKNLTLENTGTDTLVMGTIGVSCGCTGAMVTAERIAPGGTGSVRITFNSKNFSGPVHKTVTLNSNGDSQGYTTIEFTATIIDEIGLNPQSLMVPDAEVKKKSTVTISVTNNGMAPLVLTGFRTQLKGLTLKLPAGPLPPGGTATIEADFTPEAPSPMLSEGVFITTNNTRQPEVYLQVFGGVRAPKSP